MQKVDRPRKPRARDIGIPFSGTPGLLNAITDVPGTEVGYTTLVSGQGRLIVGKGPIRTGVTAILPRGRNDSRPCFGGAFTLNGAGEMTGLTWLEERGCYEGPVLITNTHSVGIVRDSAIRWMKERQWPFEWVQPIVAETYDGYLNDINGHHVKSEHVFAALDGACAGRLDEGDVGGGTGMLTYEYKGGTGSSSRKLAEKDGGYTVGVLVQSNYGERRQLRIAGIKIGEMLTTDMPRYLDQNILSADEKSKHARWCGEHSTEVEPKVPGDGSIIVIVVTDAPLLPHQLRRLAKRPSLAIGRLGGIGSARSGDIFLALSTANAAVSEANGPGAVPSAAELHPNEALSPLFEATINATEEAILNAIIAGEASEGANRLHVPRLPHDRVRQALMAHNLLEHS
jgi:D-aminopeptidase